MPQKAQKGLLPLRGEPQLGQALALRVVLVTTGATGATGATGGTSLCCTGIRWVATLLKAGVLVISPQCEDTIREFGLYRWDETVQQDRVVKENDHAMDDIRYFCATVLRRDREIHNLTGGTEQ